MNKNAWPCTKVISFDSCIQIVQSEDSHCSFVRDSYGKY